MRGWLTILLILFGAAAAYAGVERRVPAPVCGVSAELSQGDEHLHEFADVPLFASALSSASSRLQGAETLPARVRHSGPAGFVWLRAVDSKHNQLTLSAYERSESERIAPPRPADRYVYALRKIII